MDVAAGASRRATRALIDLDAIAGNVRAIRAAISSGVQVMAVVKANAYGHGARMVSEAALAAGASRLGVATVDEALQLRLHGINAPIQVLGPVSIAEVETAAEREIDVSAGSMEFVNGVALRQSGRPIRVHLKIDTGMRRFGVLPVDALAAMKALAAAPAVEIAGVFTHFGQADEVDPSPTEAQLRGFNESVAAIRTAGLPTGLVHAANSAGQLRSRDFDADLVRLGIALYGLPPSADAPLLPEMRPAMTLVSRVQRVFPLIPGDGVSYGATFRAPRPMRAALIPAGYADGYRRALSNCGEVVINDHRAPILGRVCMDQLVVGVPEGVDVVVDNEVTLWGGIGDNAIGVAQVAERAGTIAYELVSGVSARVPRVFLRDGQVVAIEDLTGLHRTR